MQLLTAFPHLALWVVSFVDEVPEEEDVKAGWIGFVVFAFLVGAVIFLGFSLSKQLRRVETSAKAGVYGPVDEPVDEPGSDGPVDASGAPNGPTDRPDQQA